MKLFFIKLECPEEVILNRIAKRLNNCDLNNYSNADKDVYFVNKERYELMPFPDELVFATINTEDDIDNQIDKIVNKLIKIID